MAAGRRAKTPPARHKVQITLHTNRPQRKTRSARANWLTAGTNWPMHRAPAIPGAVQECGAAHQREAHAARDSPSAAGAATDQSGKDSNDDRRYALSYRQRFGRRQKVRVIIHLIDGTYELFRHFYGLRRFSGGADRPYGAVAGVLNTVLQMIEEGATHLGVATDHVIESFRNRLWAGYKTGDGIEPALAAQFHPLEEALGAMGVVVWPMIELEADDALASAALLAEADTQVQKVCIWTPDKDLAQCVRGERVVQVDRKSKQIRDEQGVHAKFGVAPRFIPDLLALVGDSADGYPGIAGIGRVTAARLITRHGALEEFPPELLGERRELALLFKKLATLRTDAPLFSDVESLRWRGPGPGFAQVTERFRDPKLLARGAKAPVI
jgi:5'-3' exonuclease